MLNTKYYLFFYLLICGSYHTSLFAQITEVDTSAAAQDSLRLAAEQTDDERNRPLGDTTKVYYYYIQYPDSYFATDTSLQGFEYPQWEKKYGSNTWYNDLGNIGTPLYPLLWSATPKSGFRTGLDVLDPYRLSAKDIPYYEVGGKRPYSDLYYSQISLQNLLLKANFGHQATPNLYYGVHYSMLNYNGYYEGHRSRHQNIALTLRYKKGAYTSYATVIITAINQSENGGLLDKVPDSTATLFLSTLPVSLNINSEGSPKWENRHQYISYQHSWQNIKADSTATKKVASTEFGHRIHFEANRFKYFDKSPASDSFFYADFQTNNRGMRNYFLHYNLENELSYRQAIGGNFQKAPVLLRIFAGHRWNRVFQEPVLFDVHNLFAGVEVYDQLLAPFSYRAEAYATNSRLGLDFWLKGQLGFNWKDWVEVGGKLLFQRYEPAQNARQLYISRSLIWDNSNLLQQTQELSISGTLAWPKWWGHFELSNHTITAPIYYDTLARVAQFSGTANILQLRLWQDLHLWKFHLENEVAWQRILAGSAVYRLPELILRHKLYYEGRIFKTVKIRTGAVAHYMTGFKANAYFPLTGQFYLQNNQVLSFYPRVDLFISLKIWQLRFFVNAENLTYFLVGSRNYYTAPNYASPNWFIRIGISWQLFD